MTTQVLEKLTKPVRRISGQIRKYFGPEPMQPLIGTDNLYINAEGTVEKANHEIDAWWEKWAKINLSFLELP